MIFRDLEYVECLTKSCIRKCHDHIISTHHPLHWASAHFYGLCLYMEMFTLFTMISKLTCKQVRSKKDEQKRSQSFLLLLCVSLQFLHIESVNSSARIWGWCE